jgi:hypothetical protein
MKTALEQIVNAVLYEGYILYPYRASSQKNQRERFTFGRVYPQIYSENQNGAEPCAMQTECLLEIKNDFPKVEITVGFLQPMRREIGVLEKVISKLPENEEPKFESVPQLEVNGKVFQAWTEAVERKVSISLKDFSQPMEIPFSFPANKNLEPIFNENGNVAGIILRHQEFLEGKIEMKTESLGKNLLKISVRVLNLSPLETSDLEISKNVLQRVFASTHIVLQTQNAGFVSLLEPPEKFKAFGESCKNIGVWPVLVGDETKRECHTILASPIILYDYPQIAPESAGDFFDGTEMDEMLTLRVLTMTDAEKREMNVDGFSRKILERTHSLDGERFLKLHGVMREVNLPRAESFSSEEFFNPTKPVKSTFIGEVEIEKGDRVLIRPKRRADAMDLILAGKIAIVEAIEQDAEDKIHLALVLENDPGRDLGFARQSGHRFFYGADEVEPLKEEVSA